MSWRCFSSCQKECFTLTTLFSGIQPLASKHQDLPRCQLDLKKPWTDVELLQETKRVLNVKELLRILEILERELWQPLYDGWKTTWLAKPTEAAESFQLNQFLVHFRFPGSRRLHSSSPTVSHVCFDFLPTSCLFTPCPLCSTLLFPSPVGDACLRTGHSTRVGFEPTGHASCQLRVIGRISRLKLFPWTKSDLNVSQLGLINLLHR